MKSDGLEVSEFIPRGVSPSPKSPRLFLNRLVVRQGTQRQSLKKFQELATEYCGKIRIPAGIRGPKGPYRSGLKSGSDLKTA